MLLSSPRASLRLLAARVGGRSSTPTLRLMQQMPLGSHHQHAHHKYHPPSHALHTSGAFSDRGSERVGRRWRPLVALRVGQSRSGSSSSSSSNTSRSTAPTSSTSTNTAPHMEKEEKASTATPPKATAASALPHHHAHAEADENGSGSGGIVGRNRELLATFTMVASVLCAIDCTIFPVLLTVLPAAEWLGGVNLHAISHSVALYVVLPIGSTTTLANWLMHRNLPLVAMSVGGLSLIFMSNYPGLEEVLAWMQESRVYNTVGCGMLMGSSWLAHRHEKEGKGHHLEKGGGEEEGKKPPH